MVSFIDIIFLMLVLALVITRLYGVFGSRGDEKSVRVVLKPIDRDMEKKIVENITQVINENKETPVDIVEMSEQDKLLSKINDFNKEGFLRGARKVFEIVLSSFAKNDLAMIKELVSKQVLTVFSEVLANRKENEITAEVDFICFDKAEICNVEFLKDSVKIMVEFVSEQVNLLRNAQGEVIEGDENFVQKITDFWTFERTLDAKNNNWILVSTKKAA